MLDREFLSFLLQPPGDLEMVPYLLFISALSVMFAAIVWARRVRRPWASSLAGLLCIYLAGTGWLTAYDNRWDRYRCMQAGREGALNLGNAACRWWANQDMHPADGEMMLEDATYDWGNPTHPRVQIWQVPAADSSVVRCAANVNLYCDVLVSAPDDDGTSRRFYTRGEGFIDRPGDRRYDPE